MEPSVPSFKIWDRPWIWTLLAAHVVLWTILPWTLEHSLRLDAAEGAFGGLEWQLSYIKHPPLSEWLTAIAWYAGPFRYGAVYAISQLLVVTAVFISARFVQRLHGDKAALIVVILGLVSPFATYIPIQLNHNISVMPFWALTLVTAWFAFESDRIKPWIAFGLAVAVGIWAKYSVLHLVAGLGVAFLLVPTWRARLLTPGPWIAAVTGLVVISPHVWDIWRKGFTTLHYALHTSQMTWTELAGFSGNMLMNCLLLFGFAGLLGGLIVGWAPLQTAVSRILDPRRMTRLDILVHAALLGPIIVMVAAPAFEVRARPLWMTPLIIPVIVWWGQCLGAVGATLSVQRAMRVGVAVMGVFVVAYIIQQQGIPVDKRRYAAMDGPALADLATRFWSARAKGPIPYIVTVITQGERQAAGSIAFDLPYRTHVFETGSLVLSPWVDPADLRARGAIVVALEGIPAGFLVAGRNVSETETFPRPLVRKGRALPVTFGFIAPEGANAAPQGALVK